jgi:hypothetical protein
LPLFAYASLAALALCTMQNTARGHEDALIAAVSRRKQSSR